MYTGTISHSLLTGSVVAVPPMARDSNGVVDGNENAKIIRHIESGGVSTLLYGGNANFYHIHPSEYEDVLEMLTTLPADSTWIVPSAGPAYGVMMEQAKVLSQTDFPTVMVLPHQGITSTEGVETGFRHFVEAFGKPSVLYIKHEGYTEPESVAKLVNDGLVSWIKYAIVRDDPKQDPFLSRLVDLVDPKIIISGIGEQPAIVHQQDFGVAGFTSGCVCVNPALSQKMLLALLDGDLETAESIRQIFSPLEDLRNGINPIRVLHEAVTEAGIANTGPHLPLLSAVTDEQRGKIKVAATELLGRSA